MGESAHAIAGCCSPKGKTMEKKKAPKRIPRAVRSEKARQHEFRTFSVTAEQLQSCSVGSMVASHWKEDGTCRCKDIEAEKESLLKVDSVEKILEGAYASLELISEDELRELEKRYTTYANLQQKQHDQDRHVSILLFIRTARERLYPLGKGL